MTEIVILSGARTPIGHMGGLFKTVSATDLGAAAIKAAVARAKISPEQVDEVYMGCVLPAGLGQAPARQAAIYAGIPTKTPCTTINKMCGSALKSVMLAADAIRAGTNNVVVAGGMENMTRAPFLFPEGRFGHRLGHTKIFDHMMLDGLEDVYEPGKAMGCFAEQCAEQFHFTREQQDNFAITSLERAQKASKEGWFDEEITPITITSKKHTEEVRLDEGPLIVKAEKISQLAPAFKKDGTVTAANSSSISDGAAAVVISSLEFAEKNKIKPLAKILAHHTAAQNPELFTTAPIAAISGLLAKLNWHVADVDLFEINEAFAVVPMAAMRELNIPHEKVNVHGGACVLGHPIGASGARVLVTLIYALKQQQKKRGIAALCLGGGEAVAVAIEMF